MRKLALAGMASLAFVSSSAPLAPPSITRIETVGYTNLQGPVSTPYLKPGVPKEYWIQGPWLDHVNAVRIDNVSQARLGTKDLGNGIGQIHVRLSVPSTTTRGVKPLQVHIDCGVFGVSGFGMQVSDCRTGWHVRDLMVLQTGTVSTVTPDANLIMNQRDTFVVNGSGLNNAGVIS